jgi:hypothetical protein
MKRINKIFLPSESQELHPTFNVDGVRFTYAQYDKRTPGLFKVETPKHKMISLCSKMSCASEDTDYCECCACQNYIIIMNNILDNL